MSELRREFSLKKLLLVHLVWNTYYYHLKQRDDDKYKAVKRNFGDRRSAVACSGKKEKARLLPRLLVSLYVVYWRVNVV